MLLTRSLEWQGALPPLQGPAQRTERCQLHGLMHTACIAPGSERPTVRSIADARDRLVTVNSALAKASALDPQPVLGGVGVVSNRLYGLLVIT
jgi:hypothetical protein